ncbi:class B sortase [Lachnospiraceae bacterium C1.1]|nr:class B sortase [Lachnospiraceae bacterium C1.1]
MDKRVIARVICLLIAIASFGYIGFYYYQKNHSDEKTTELAKKGGYSFTNEKDPLVVESTVEDKSTGSTTVRKLFVLRQYRSLYQKNPNFAGWIKIDGTEIDYPVMKSRTGNGEYYLDHNFSQEEDRNGTLFMEDNCDIERPSENWIIYGHNMKSGNMFGTLDNYKSESFCKEHPYINFDTIYETGIYEVMFAFQSHVYTEAEIAFKYYQFIDPASEAEFNSGIEQMRADSYYDMGIDVEYGDRLLILSTCDYDESNGRFVVVAVRKDEL